jgi:hypothetical protein
MFCLWLFHDIIFPIKMKFIIWIQLKKNIAPAKLNTISNDQATGLLL